MLIRTDISKALSRPLRYLRRNFLRDSLRYFLKNSLGYSLGQGLKFGRLTLLGIVLSMVLNGVFLSSTTAQTTVPNQAAVQYDIPDNGTGETQRNNLSNEVTYPLGVVLGENTLGLSLVKSADKAAAEPGDVVIYQLLVQNKSTRVADNLQISDTLPLGVQLVDDSVTGDPADPTEVVVNGRNLTLSFPPLAPGSSLTVTYVAVMTPDAVRGDGRNVALVSAEGFETVESIFRLTIRQGILSDCGTIIGRVFVDKNFDGQQQPGEPGVPNAVVYLETGNRIITDPDGLFSVANALWGNRVGTLDLTSLPGYTLAPNLFRVEENSQSRLVRLLPGGLARMNFAVTPTFGEGEG